MLSVYGILNSSFLRVEPALRVVAKQMIKAVRSRLRLKNRDALRRDRAVAVLCGSAVAKV
jgi:hypothetical protein